MGIEAGWDEWADQQLILDERASGFSRYVKNFVMKGFGLAPGVGLSVVVGEPGINVAYVNGYEIRKDNASVLGLTASAVNHVFLKFTKDPDPIAGTDAILISFTVNTTGVQPPDSIKLGTVTTNGVGVTAVANQNNKFKLHDFQLETDGDANQKRLRRLVMDNGTAFPTVPAPVGGEWFFRTDLGLMFFFDGAVWQVSVGAPFALSILEDGASVEAAAFELDFQDGIIATFIAAGQVALNLDYGASVSGIVPDDFGSPGISPAVSREDHEHAIVTDPPVDINDVGNSEGTAFSFSRSDHEHYHGELGGGDLHDLVTPDPGGVAGFMSPADKKLLDDLNPGPAGFCWGKTIFVDSECGDDATGARNDASRPFLTLAAAAVAVGIIPGDIIWLRPGDYDMAADFTIPIGVTIHGMDRSRVRIRRLLAPGNATLITMSVDSALYDVTLELTSDLPIAAPDPAITLRAVNFPGATTATAKLKNVVVLVENVSASGGSTSEVIGIRVGSTGTPGKYHASLEDVEILVQSKGNGKKRCLLLESSGGVANCRNVNGRVERQGATGTDYIAVEIDQVGAILYMQDGSSEVSPAAAGADVSQTAGTLQLSNHVLVTNNANAKGLTAFDSNHEVWSVEGVVTNGAVTRFMRPGSAPETTLEIQRRISRPIIVFGLALLARVHAGVAGSQTTTVTVRKNGVDTVVLVALPDGTTTIAFTANASVSFAEGDLLSMKIVSTGLLVATDVQATLKHY